MTKRLVDIDDDLLAAAREQLEASSIKETVNEALREILAQAARRREMDRWSSGEFPDLGNPEIMRGAWR